MREGSTAEGGGFWGKAREGTRRGIYRVPLLLPLGCVVGVILGGAIGWGLAAILPVVALSVRAYRVMYLALCCGVVVILCTALRERNARQLHLAPETTAPLAVRLEGTVVAELNKGCILETSPLGVRVAVYGEGEWKLGEIYRVVGQPMPTAQPLVPGMFSQEEWMRGQGLVARLACIRAEKVGTDIGRASLMRVAAEVRKVLADRLMPRGTEGDIRRQVLCALVLGEKDRADPATIELFRRGGCLHAFAVSGLHVGIVAGILWFFLKLFRVHPKIGWYVQLVGVGAYVFATGMAVPALRAYMMIAVILGALILRRRPSLCNTWALAALLVLMLQPWQFFQPGFLLSFTVYAVICLAVRYLMPERTWFGPDSYIPVRIYTRWERFRTNADLFVRGIIVVSFSAWLASLPITIMYFHAVAPGSYVVNILLSPLLPVVMFCGLVTLAVGSLPALGPLSHAISLQTAGWLVGLVGLSDLIPGAYIPAVVPAQPGDYRVFDLGHGRGVCVLGNPGVLVGDVHLPNQARYAVQPALFHAGFSPVLCMSPVSDGARKIYAQTWSELRFLSFTPGSKVRCYTSRAGEFTVFPAPAGLPTRYRGNAAPIVHWKRPDGSRVLYIGNAAMSTLMTIPEAFRHVEVVILGFNTHEPIFREHISRKWGVQKVIMLPNAEKADEADETDISRED